MKFLLVSPLTNASGSAIRFWNIAQALVERGHRVVYAERKSGHASQLHACEGVIYYACPTSGIMPLDMALSLLFYMAVFLRHIDCDLFYALKPAPNNCTVALAAKLLGKKTVLDVDDLDYAYLPGAGSRRLLRFFFDGFPRMFPLVTYHTPSLRQYLMTYAHVSENRLHYLAQGVSAQFVSRGTASDAPDPDPQSLLYVATLGITSDFGDIVEPLASLLNRFPGAHMSVAGDGCRRGEFEQRVREAGIGDRVRFTGTVEHSALPSLVAAHRIGINYMRPAEVNQCRAILKIREYLACGLDVVCNNVGDVELFRGYIHVEPDIDAMFRTVASLLCNPARRNREAIDFIRREFNWSSIVADFESAIP